MKTLLLGLVLLTGVSQAGCGFLAGAAVGALAASGGYEYNTMTEMDQLNEDFLNGRISRSEYENRKAQIEQGSVLK